MTNNSVILHIYPNKKTELAARFIETLANPDGTVEGDYLAQRSADILLKGNKNAFQRVLDYFKDLVAKFKVKRTLTSDEKVQFDLANNIWNNLQVALDNAKAGGVDKADSDVNYSIRHDDNGRPYVNVDENILEGVAFNDYGKVIRNILANKFSDGIPVDDDVISVSRKSRREYAKSGYTQHIKNKNPQIYEDKMRMANNIDEILQTAELEADGGLRHRRKDDFVDFEHGNVLIEVGDNAYKADVVVGMKANGKRFFYDIISLKPAKINKNGRCRATANQQINVGSRYQTPADNNLPQSGMKVKRENEKNYSRTRKFVESVANSENAEMLDENLQGSIKRQIEEGKFEYKPVSNEKTLNKARWKAQQNCYVRGVYG